MFIDTDGLDEALQEWLDTVSFDAEPKLGKDGLPVVEPDPDDPDDDYGPQEDPEPET